MPITTRSRFLVAAVLGLATGTIAVACGARSELFVGDRAEGGAGPDAAPDVKPDVKPDVPIDVPPDIPEDALPDCNTDALFIYLVTGERDLYRFNPSTLEFSRRGVLDCASGVNPFSMGVNRKGRAYVLYGDGQLFRVNVDNATCAETEFVPGQIGFDLFGMGFSLDEGEGERLYVAEINFESPSAGLARVNPDTLALEFIGPFSQNPGNTIEMTGSDDGELWGYMLSAAGDGGFIVRIDKDTAEILETIELSAGAGSPSLAFAYWGGDFFVFSGEAGITNVTRYRPSTGVEELITTLDREVVGAGVSTCKIMDP